MGTGLTMRAQTETRTPRSMMEEEEDQERQEDAHGMDHNEMAFAFGRVLAWLLEGKSLAAVGTRVFVAAHKIRPDIIQGRSLDSIAKMSGQGRSAAHKLSKDFEAIFQVHGIHDRSEEARRKYSEAWQRTNGTKPHTYNPTKRK